MSTQDQITKRYPIFELLRSRPDWQTAQPRTAEERTWYRVGFQMSPDREISDPVSSVPPVEMRFWWALGLTDGLSKTPSRVALEEKRPDGDPDGGGSLWKWGLAAGLVGAVAGIGLLVSSGGKHE